MVLGLQYIYIYMHDYMLRLYNTSPNFLGIEIDVNYMTLIEDNLFI